MNKIKRYFQVYYIRDDNHYNAPIVSMSYPNKDWLEISINKTHLGEYICINIINIIEYKSYDDFDSFNN